MIYAKLVIKNAKRSVRDYLIYLVTLTLCAALFYAFLSIASKYYHPAVGAEFSTEYLKGLMPRAMAVLMLPILFLIQFVNRYMLRARQKEFALQAVMGMEQSVIAWMFLAETMLIGMIALALGLLLGGVLSQLVSAMVLTNYGEEFQFMWTLFPDTALLTAAFFLAVFLVSGFLNRRALKKKKSIDMLSARRRNEKSFRKSLFLPGILLLWALLLFWAAAVGNACMAYYDSRHPIPIRMMLWSNRILPWAALALLIVLSVCCLARKLSFQRMLNLLLVPDTLLLFWAAALPAIGSRYAFNMDSAQNSYLMFIMGYLTLAVAVIFYNISGWLEGFRRRSPETRYRGDNLFFFGQILSKLKSTSQSMTVICLTLALGIGLLLMEPGLCGWADGYLELRSGYSVQISSEYNQMSEEEDLRTDDYSDVRGILEENHAVIRDMGVFTQYFIDRDDFYRRVKYDFPELAVGLSDYNTVRRLNGLSGISLGEGEYAVHWDSLAMDEEKEELLTEKPRLETDAGAFSFAEGQSFQEGLGETFTNLYTSKLYILPDDACGALLGARSFCLVQTEEPMSVADAKGAEAELLERYPETVEGKIGYYVKFQTLQRNEGRMANFLMQALLTGGGIVLLLLGFTALALQQLLDCAQYRERFLILRALGAEPGSIRRIILRQLALWFGLPCALALVLAGTFTAYFCSASSVQLAAYMGFDELAVQTAAVASVLIALIACYFVSTWLLFERAAQTKERGV